MEETECSETSAYKIQTPGNYPEENIQHVQNWNKYIRKKKRIVRQVCYLRELNRDTRTTKHKIK